MCFMSGSNAGQASEQAASEQAQLYDKLISAFTTQYGAQSAITNALTAAMTPYLTAGPNQYGFSPGEQAALSTESLEGAANANTQAQQAINTGEARSNSTGLPSGARTQVDAEIADAAANQNAQQQLGIRQAGYEQGMQNYANAANTLGRVASIENPLGYADEASSADKMLIGNIGQENALNPNEWGLILGGIAQMGLAAATGGFGAPSAPSAPSGIITSNFGTPSGPSDSENDGLGNILGGL